VDVDSEWVSARHEDIDPEIKFLSINEIRVREIAGGGRQRQTSRGGMVRHEKKEEEGGGRGRLTVGSERLFSSPCRE
jgi:hypothetical protein